MIIIIIMFFVSSQLPVNTSSSLRKPVEFLQQQVPPHSEMPLQQLLHTQRITHGPPKRGYGGGLDPDTGRLEPLAALPPLKSSAANTTSSTIYTVVDAHPSAPPQDRS